IVAEAMLAYVITDAILEKFGGDSLEETIRNYRAYIEYVRSY
ncbi:MAG: chorismate synthase, partial [candidate division WOR-3 bacterium]